MRDAQRALDVLAPDHLGERDGERLERVRVLGAQLLVEGEEGALERAHKVGVQRVERARLGRVAVAGGELSGGGQRLHRPQMQREVVGAGWGAAGWPAACQVSLTLVLSL